MAKKKEAKKKTKKKAKKKTKKQIKKKPITSNIHETFDWYSIAYEEALDIWFDQFFEYLEILIREDVSPKRYSLIEQSLIENLVISIVEVVVRPFERDESIDIKLKIRGRKSDIKTVNRVLEARDDIDKEEYERAQQWLKSRKER